MADIVGAIFTALSCICGTPTCNCIDQYRNFDHDVGKLRRELDTLTNRKQDIESGIEVAEARRGQMVRREVQDWLKQVQDINVDVQAFLEKVQGIKCYKRACLYKLVCRKINVVREMLEKGSFPGGLFIDKAPARGNRIPTENLVGEISTKEEIWGYLMGDEVGMIGVCGIGGVGKTTIMKNLHHDLQRETRFQKVIWVTVSHPLNVFELQKKIAGAMGERLLNDDKDDDGVMKRAGELMDIMEGVKFVVILDDVWENFSLREVGILDPKAQNGCKVVVTSRSIEVCSYLSCKIVKVQPLSQEESLKLFLNTVGDVVLEIPRLEEIVELIVEECAGLPLAIVVIAGSMKGVDDVNVWRNALAELRDRVKSVKDSNDEIFKRLRFSFDRLDSLEVKNCFLYCSFFKEDYVFSRRELIECWIDEGIFDGLPSREAAYNRGHAIIDRLEKNFLLEKDSRLVKFSIHGVHIPGAKMHDVVRDMAIISIGPEFGYMIKAGMNLVELPDEHGWVKDPKKLSLMANDILKVPLSLSPKCSALSTLILSSNSNLSEIPESFFGEMLTLKVLDLSSTAIETLPNSISELKNLSTLRLQLCKKLKYLPSLANLRGLKKLDLHRAGIEVLPQGMEMLISLEYLDLLFCPNLKEIPTGILLNLSSLQYLAVCCLRETTIVRNFEEVARLKKLETLECYFDGIQDFNYFVNKFKDFQRAIAYSLLVGSAEDMLRMSKHELVIIDCEIGEEGIVLPNKLEYLWISKLKNMGSSLSKIALLEKANELRTCHISSCEEIECVVELHSSSSSSSSSLRCPVFDKLEDLSLYGLPGLCKLVRMEGEATPPHVFSNLKKLYVRSCYGIRKLLPLELLQAFQNLEVIAVVCCTQIVEIITSLDSDASSSNKFTFTFPKLRELRLAGLPQLKSICSAKGVMVCNSIEKIRIGSCPELKRIPVQLPQLDNGQPSPPPHLREIWISASSKEWWESLEWDHPNAKNLLQPFVNIFR
ncbi:hypothetical protein SLEP1_g40360 [Rubroshorea leprosula]|uniref:AAA+ ATPase domain-containing protein n=1 Tax=Rubroshorea leprosula TaxID=152421 RepID=A0AAV5L365_9ROSI|nr:hypothetical protein SLEP1_g40360 [Rubroshorea leprosula]